MSATLLSFLLLGSVAQAGDILVTGYPAILTVDGQMLQAKAGQIGFVTDNLSEGTHLLEARNIANTVIASIEVEIPEDKRVMVQYKRKAFTVTGVVEQPESARPAAAAPPPPPPPPPEPEPAESASVQVSSGGTTTSIGTSAGASSGSFSFNVEVNSSGASIATTASGAPVTTTTTSSGGLKPRPNLSSVSFVGVDPMSWSIYLGGNQVPWVPELGAFVAAELAPGSYPFSLKMMGNQVLTADYTTTPGAHESCILRPHPMGVDTSCSITGDPVVRSEISGSEAFGGSGSITINIGTAPAQPQQPAQAVPVEPPPPQPMSEAELSRLIEAVDDATFPDDQVDVLRTAAAHHHFTCSQVVRLIDPLAHSSDKVEAVRVLRGAILDPENYYVLEKAFVFSSAKEEVRAMFR